MFVQRKVMGILYGQPAAEFDAIGGVKRMTDDIEECGCDHTFTCLLPTLNNIDPDDAFSSVHALYTRYLTQVLLYKTVRCCHDDICGLRVPLHFPPSCAKAHSACFS